MINDPKFLMLAIPILIIHVCLMIYTLRIIIKTKRAKLFPIYIWVLLIVLLNIFGSLAFLLWGREYEDN